MIFEIDAYDVDAWTAVSGSAKTLRAAKRYAEESLIRSWQNVEIRQIDPVTNNGIVIMAWENGEPVEVDKRAFA